MDLKTATRCIAALLLAAVFSAASYGTPIVYKFYAADDDPNYDSSAQLSATLVGNALTFQNDNTNDVSNPFASITGVYFFSTTYLPLTGIGMSTGVNFEQVLTEKDKQGWGQTAGLEPVLGYRSRSPTATNGINNPSEWLTLTLQPYSPGVTWESLGGIPGDSFGIKVQAEGTDGEGSGKYLISSVPVPDGGSTVFLIGAALTGIHFLVRRRRHT